MSASVAYVTRQTMEATEARDLEDMLVLYADDIVHVGNGSTIKGTSDFRHHFSAVFAPYSEMRVDTVREVEIDDLAISEYVFTALDSGDLVTAESTIPATGRRVSVPLLSMQRVRDGLIVEEGMTFDDLTLLTQLGLAGS